MASIPQHSGLHPGKLPDYSTIYTWKICGIYYRNINVGRKSGILSQITEIDWLGHTRHFLVMVPFSSHSKPKFYNQCEA